MISPGQNFSRLWDRSLMVPRLGKTPGKTYPDPDGEFEEQIPGQDNIMNHPEYLPGKLHGRKFEHCIYLPEEDCISEDCGLYERRNSWTSRKQKNRS